MTEPLQEIIEEPLGDDDLRYYFSKARILKYNQLVQYSSIEALLPEERDFCFLLIEDSPNRGHWVALLRHHNQIEFFDSFGGKVDSQLSWSCPSVRRGLGQCKTHLSDLLNQSPFEVVYNPIPYQQDGQDINTCGRHCVLRIVSRFSPENLNLSDYYSLMKYWKKQTGQTYDEIVASLITRT